MPEPQSHQAMRAVGVSVSPPLAHIRSTSASHGSNRACVDMPLEGATCTGPDAREPLSVALSVQGERRY